MYALYPESEHPAHSPIQSVSHFFFGGDAFLCLACAKSEAATVFSAGGVFLLPSSLPAMCAGFFPVVRTVSP